MRPLPLLSVLGPLVVVTAACTDSSSKDPASAGDPGEETPGTEDGSDDGGGHGDAGGAGTASGGDDGADGSGAGADAGAGSTGDDGDSGVGGGTEDGDGTGAGGDSGDGAGEDGGGEDGGGDAVDIEGGFATILEPADMGIQWTEFWTFSGTVTSCADCLLVFDAQFEHLFEASQSFSTTVEMDAYGLVYTAEGEFWGYGTASGGYATWMSTDFSTGYGHWGYAYY